VDLELTDVTLRLLAATIAGGLLGLNRDIEQKPIGIRTLGLVSLGAAVISVAAIEVPGLYENKDALSRVVQGLIQGVMAGIGFIGAGVILRRPDTQDVQGLTTAATVWVAAALGICCGLGRWDVVLIGSVLSIVVLVGFKRAFKLFRWDVD
jgi:putative Mg2+ transporter-C (MgtC) family protein